MDEDELKEIMKALKAAFAEAGKSIETAVLYTEDNEDGEMIVDNRDEDSIN